MNSSIAENPTKEKPQGLGEYLQKWFPQELIELDQWVCYRLEWNEERGKNDKKPVNPATGKLASTTDPRTWGTFAQAVARAEAGNADGVGFVFTEADPYAGIDLDHCLGEEEADADGAPTKPVEPWAWEQVKRLASYTEESPSGTGLHIIVRATLPPGGRKNARVEMYDSGRFFTVTGQTYAISDIVEARQSEVEALHAEEFPPKITTPQNGAQKPTQPVDLDDQQLIEKAKNAKNGTHFERLYSGNANGYGSQSEADLALCNNLAFWTGGDAQRVDRLFRASGLMRDKWDRKAYADGRTYGEATVALAVGTTTDFYSPRAYSNGTGPGASHSEETPAEGNERSTWPYGVRNGQLVERQMVKIDDEWEEKQYPIADFTACIGGVIANEEGEETYTVTGDALRGGPFRCEIPALDFGDTRKLAAALGAAAGPFDPILAGKAQHLAPAIKKLTSDQLTRTRRYHRTGWAGDHFLLPGREPDNTEIALHRKLPYAIARSGDLAKGLQGLEALIHSMGPEVATIFLSALFQAPMAKPANWRGERYALFITGRSGTLKTSNSQAAMGLYGPGFMSDDALTKWGEGATENALMQMATQAHDLPFLVDNYKPNTGKGAQGWVAITHNILEGGEKDRLNRAAQLRDTKPIFCWPIFTGEDVPNVDAASLARVLIVPFSEENRTPKRTAQLAIAQDAARLGHLSTVGAAWLEWLESKEGQQVAKDAGARLLEYRSQWAAHLTQRRPDMVNPLRVATNLASNQLTWAAVCQHPTIGPMAIEHLESHRSGLLAISDEMANYTAEVLEAARFLAGLRELLATGRGLLVMNENHEAQIINQNAQDRIIGWTDNNAGAYLLPEIARLMVERVIGDLHISNTTLYDQIDTLGFLGRRDKGRKNYTKRIGNKTQKVLHIIGAALTDDVDPPTVEE